MAKSGALDEISGELRAHCPQCQEMFSDPRVLPCLHTLCMDCLSKLEPFTTMEKGQKRRSLLCPMCDSEVALPAGGVKDFLPDMLAQTEVLRERLRSGGHQMPCDLCADGKGERRCQECKINMCEFCCQAHSMAAREDFVEQLRAAVTANGADWLQEQLRLIMDGGPTVSGGGSPNPRARRSRPPERYSPEADRGSARPAQRGMAAGEAQTPNIQAKQRDGRGEARGNRRKVGGTGGRVPSNARGSSPPARRRCLQPPERSAGEGRKARDAQECTAASGGRSRAPEMDSSPPQGDSGSERDANTNVRGGNRRSARTPRSSRRRSPSPGVSSGPSGTQGRSGRTQHRRPSATTASASGVHREIGGTNEQDDRSEGELSGSDGGDNQGHQASLVPGVAAVGRGPVQPGQDAGLVWILGHSYVFWGAKRADVRPNGRQLRIPRQEALIRRQKRTAAHCLLLLRDLPPGSSLSPAPYCSLHPLEELGLFCEVCAVPSCRDCALLKHHGHELRPVMEVAVKHKEQLRGALKKWDPQLEGLEKTLNAVYRVGEDLRQRADMLREEVEVFTEGYIQAVQEHRLRLLRDIDEEVHRKEQGLNLQKARVHQQLSDLRTATSFTRGLLHCGPDHHIVRAKVLALSRLKDLSHGDRSKPEQVEPVSIRFSPLEEAGLCQGYQVYGAVQRGGVDPDRCEVKGQGLHSGSLGALCSFTVISKNKVEEPREQPRVTVLHKESGRALQPSIQDNHDGTFQISYTPTEVGQLSVSVCVKGRHIKGSPFNVTVKGTPRSHPGIYHCCTFCSSGGQKDARCGCGGTMPGGYQGCGHGHKGHPGRSHWSCCGSILEKSECSGVKVSAPRNLLRTVAL